MSLTVGELFVNLGVKGSEKTMGAIAGTRKGLNEAASSGLAAKAAILAVVYGMEQLMSRSAQVGTSLTNFTALTGLSADELQRWQYGMRQAGGSAEEMTANVQNVQKAMAQIDLNKGVPEGLFALAQAAGGIDFSKKDDPFYMLRAFEKGLNHIKGSPKADAIMNYLAGTVGLTGGFIAGARRGKFDESVLSKAPLYGANERSQLDKTNVAMSNLGQKVEMAFGHFTAKHGLQLVNDLSKVTTQVFKLAEAFTTLAEKLQVFKGIGKVFEGWAIIFGGLSKGVDAVAGAAGNPKKQQALGNEVGQFFKELPGVFKAMFEDISPEVKGKLANIFAGDTPLVHNAITPQLGNTAGSQVVHNTEINQNLHFQHEGKDHQQTAGSVKQAIQHFVRQSSAQAQGS